MSADDTQPGRDELQFDRVETGQPLPDGDAANPAVTCAVCQKPIDTEYYHINGKPVCESCRHVVSSAATTPRGAGPLLRAVLFGVGAAIAGAAIYYGVIALTGLEIGIVAILIGYMVGYSVRKAAAGRGGRRFQILAVALTYWSVGLAYTPLAFKELSKGSDGAGDTTAVSRSDSSRADSVRAGVLQIDSARSNPARGDSMPIDSARATTSAASDSLSTMPPGPRSFLLGLAIGLVFVFALPIIAIVGSMPSGLISAFIIFIGLRQAWQMTATPKLEVSGPYRVGTRASPAGD